MELYPLQFMVFFLLPILCFVFYNHNSTCKKSPNPPSMKPYPLLGNLPQIFKHRRNFLDWSARILAESPTHTIVLHIPGQVSGLITSNPANIEYMLKTNFANYPKGHRAIGILRDFLGHGIFNSDGDHWNWQRKAASYEFNKKSLRSFLMDTVQREVLGRLLPLLARAEEESKVVDLQDVLERFAFDNICNVAFGEDPHCLREDGAITESPSDLVRAFGDASHLVVDRFNGLFPFTWRLKRLLNIGSERRVKEAVGVINDFASKIIRSRKAKHASEGIGGDDLLSRFASNDDNSDEYLRDIVISFIVAGLETTSSALTWFFWQLASRPDVEEKILEEVKSIRSVSGDTFSYDELREMHYLHAALSESLRLYAPVPVDTQSSLNDDVMPDGTFVGKDWFVTYNAYAVGRLEDVWGKDCMEYRPERWLENGVFRPESPFRFPVFHAGPRMCLGKEMAYIQMKSIVACVLERFKVDVLLPKDEEPEKVLWLTIRMKAGLPIRVSRRESLNALKE